MRFLKLLTLGAVVAGCSGAAPRAETAAATTKSAAATPASAAASPTTAGVVAKEVPELGKELEAARVTGTIALYDSQDSTLSCSDLKKCQEAVIPASTFKIPHSMIALETGVVEGPDTILPWDKKQYWVEAWNRDLSFRDAFRLSCVPCYRAIARKVGDQREREWLEKLDYGNHDTSGGVDKFWLWGNLRISPLEQVDFLRRFDGDKLPIAPRTADLVRDIMTLDVTENYVLRGKTGSTSPPEEPRELNWFVGWLERGERRVFFALLMDGHAEGVDAKDLRRPLTERILKSRGLL
jgi:beta-lactamase class D